MSPVFATAFWDGLAGPSALYAAPVGYRPAISHLTSGNSFALVGVILAGTMRELDVGAGTTTAGIEGQLAFEFWAG